MTYAASAVAAWVTKYNQSQTDLANQTAATIAEHNARYVNNAGTGQLWSDRSAQYETLYNQEVAAYNDMVNQRNAAQASANTWQANANTAYVTGTWGSGETWHAAYDRVLPPAEALTFDGSFAGGTCPASGTIIPTINSGANSLGLTNNGNYLTVNKTGRYFIYAHCSNGTDEAGNNTSWALDILTSLGTTSGLPAHMNSGQFGGGNQGSGPKGDALGHAIRAEVLSAGQTIQFRLNQFGGGYNAPYPSGGNQIHIEFVPSQTYPH